MTLQQQALARLEHLFGSRKAKEELAAALSKADMKGIETSDDLLLFANTLIAQEGLLAVVGSALRVKALLAGASS